MEKVGENVYERMRRVSVDGNVIAAGLRELAHFFEDVEQGGVVERTPAVPVAPVATPAPRGRGRPPKAAETPATPPEEKDPFDTATAPAVTVTQDDVRAALVALKEATSQENALKVLKGAGGADNLPSLKPEKYAAVVAAAKAATTVKEKPVVEDDPFGEAPAAAPAKKVTAEDVKAAVVAAQKRTSQDTVQKLVMSHGGKAAKDGGGEGPSLKALPESKYAEVIAALEALPTTK